jgi:hypothetical protein
MDDFVYVLIAGLVLLAIALLAFNLMGISAPTGSDTLNITSFSLGEIGVSDTSSTTTDLGDFTVGETNTDSLDYQPQVTVTASIFGGSGHSATLDIPDYLLGTAKNIWIRYNVHEESGEYGDLVIKWNGKELYNGMMDRGDKEVFIAKGLVSTKNTLDIYAEHNPVFFWATATYVLRDLDVQIEYGDIKAIPFTISQAQKETFQKGEATFDADGSGDLVAKVNGIEIFRGEADGETTLEFDLFDTQISLGNNVLSLAVEDGTYTLSGAYLKIYTSSRESVKVREFTLTPEQYDLLSTSYRGKITMDVLRIDQAGELQLRLNGHRLDSPGLKTGENTAYFTGYEGREGENELSFSGSGQWDFGEASVVLEKA